MSHNIYNIIVTPLTKRFKAMDAILDKLTAHCAANNTKDEVFLNDRLFPDMLPFSSQIRIATDMTKGSIMRLTGTEVPTFEDNETTIAELKNRIGRLIILLDSIKPQQFEGADDKAIVITRRNGEDMHFIGTDYVHDFVIPNVYFHLATAYNILRHRGVVLGKADFLMGSVKA